MEGPPPNDQAKKNTWRILIIDDDEDDTIITRNILSKSKGDHWFIDWAPSYEQGREKLFSGHYQAVLLDYQLGKHTGLDLIREAVHQNYPAPLILHTGVGSDELEQEAMQAGAALYLTKNEANPVLLARIIRYAIHVAQREQAQHDSEVQFVTARKLAERAQHESEARYRRLVEHANEGIWTIDAHGFTDTINRRGAEILGYQVEEVLGQPALSFWLAEDVPAAHQRLERSKQGVGEIFETRMRHKDGHEVWIRSSTTPIYGEGSQYLGAQSMFIDISDQREAEKKLNETLEQLAWLARFPEENPNPVVRAAAGGLVLYRNLTAARAPGWLCQVGQPLPVPLQALVTQAMRQQQELQRDIELGERYYSISIMPFPAENYANLYGRDITSRKQVEAALQQSEARFRQLADALPQLVWTAQADGTVDYYNERVHEYKGIQQQDNGSWDWSLVLHPDDTQLTQDSWARAVETGEIYRVEHRIQISDSSFRWHLSRGIPVRDEHGQVIRWFGSATDIHELKQSETILTQYSEMLKHSNQELEQFALVASHDLQEPLRKIKLFGSRIQEKLRGKMDAETEDHFARMLGATQRMNAMIDDLLELSRISTQGRPFTPVDLSQVADEVVSDLETQISRVQGRVLIEQLPVIDGDPTQMHQVLQNLIANALKFQKPDTPIEVKVSSVTFQAESDRRTMVSILVNDNGIGFKEQYFEQILQPFQRLHGRSEYEGNGMGLSIVKKIIDRHQGEFTAHSQPGQGSTFVVTLPKNQNH